MEIENIEIYQFVSDCEPISKLDEETRKKLTLSINIRYVKRGQNILTPGDINQSLFMIRSGAIERINHRGEVTHQCSEKDFFGYASLLRGGKVVRVVRALEDTLLYCIPSRVFNETLKNNPYFQFYFSRDGLDDKSYEKGSLLNEDIDFSYLKVNQLIHDELQLVDHKTSVADCAKIMTNSGITSLLVTQNEEVKGIVTDRAFCTKVVASNLSHETPIGVVMTDQLLTIDQNGTASEALMIMARHNFRHLPVTVNERIVGVLTASDLIHRQSNNPIYLVNQISKSNSKQKLVHYAEQIPKILSSLVDNGHSAKDITSVISSIGRAINLRLLQMAELKFGEPPVGYCWIVAGSLARDEQAGFSDQDNGIIIDNAYRPEIHAQYFFELATFVCDGLNECGYVYCPGNVMATNDKWRQPSSVWRRYFETWIITPKPKALMYASIFFDLKVVHGDKMLLNGLYQDVSQMISQNKKFLNFMASNALQFTPPLGLFRTFVLEAHGREEKALNLKKRGVVPVTDFARVSALASGAKSISTLDRLEWASQHRELSQAGLKDMTDAYEFISGIRLEHQARQVKKGQTPDNFLSPEELSSLERRHLKNAFEVIRDYQKTMESRYQTGLIG